MKFIKAMSIYGKKQHKLESSEITIEIGQSSNFLFGE